MTDDVSATTELGDYLREIARYPLLTAHEEIQLARELAEGRKAASRLTAGVAGCDKASLQLLVEAGALARKRLIESNLRLVVSVARRYRGHGSSIQDLIQEGNIGLQTGIEKYDWRKGYRLSTYIYWWIRQAITRALANDSRTIRLPVHVGEMLRSAAHAEQQLEAELGSGPTVAQVAARAGLQPERLRAIRLASSAVASLDAPFKREGTLTYADMLADPVASDSPRITGEEADLRQSVASVLEELPERERNVVELHYGLGRRDALTLAEIGQRMGITRERARQIESQALRRLRADTRMRRALLDLATD